MSHTDSPYSQPMSSGPAGPSRNTVTVVAMVAVTCLLMCGGLIGFGIYAVDRLADSMIESGDDEWYEDEVPQALEFAIKDDPDLRELVGDIQHVEHDQDLTYDLMAADDDFYYRVEGSAGKALLVVEFDYGDERWFKSVQLVQGDGVFAPRVPVAFENPPFDTQWSRLVFETLALNDPSVVESLGIGDITRVYYDYEASLEQTPRSRGELLFEIHGESGSVEVLAMFSDAKFQEIESIHVVDSEGNRLLYESQPASD